MSDSNFLLKRIGTYDLSGIRLGKGNFAYVELATNRVSHTKVAIKIIDVRKIKDEYVRKNILREALILKKVHHPNIVHLYETLKQRSLYCLITEYVAGGELLGHLRAQRDCRFSESQARPIIRQMVSALHHLHEQGIVHRDLKMENILFDESKQQIKIIDFGLSNTCGKGEYLKTQCGSPEYAAPELFKKGCRYGTEVDVWSLGVNIYGMVVGKLPFRSAHTGGRDHSELVDQMSRGLYAIQGRHMAHLTPECKDLLLRLLEPNPQQRIPLIQVMEHPWVTQNGLCPLIPYSPPPVADELTERVLDKTSALIKIRKQKVRLHVEKNRYDAICGIYNMLLDQELKNLYGGRFCGDFEFEFEREACFSDDEFYLSDSAVVSYPECGRFHEQSRKRYQEVSYDNSNDIMKVTISPKPRYEDNAATVTREDKARQQNNIIYRRCASAKEQIGRSILDTLTVRGLKVMETERPFTPTCKKSESKTRPNSAIDSYHTMEQENRTSRQPQHHDQPVIFHSYQSKVGECEPVRDLQGTRIILSTRSAGKQDKIPGCETPFAIDTQDCCHDDETIGQGVNVPFNIGERVAPEGKPDEDNTKSTPEKSAESIQKNVTEQKENVNVSGSGREVGTEVQYAWTAVEIPKSSAMKTRTSRATTNRPPVKQTLDVPVAHAYRCPHSPTKSYTKAQSPMRFTGAHDQQCSSKITGEVHSSPDRLSSAYQMYLAKNKPQHKRLSIMQAQEIFQHERKFTAKYGRSSTPGSQNGPEVSVEESEQHVPRSRGEASQRDESNCREKCGSKLPQRSKQSPPSVKPGYTGGVVIHTEHRELSLATAKYNAAKEKREPSRSQAKQVESDDVAVPSSAPVAQPNTRNVYCELMGHALNREKTDGSGELSPRQHDSLKRKKQVELMLLAEKEKLKITKELQDKERIKMIQQYLDDVYVKPEAEQHMDNKEPRAPRAYKVTRHGRLYSLLPRSETAGLYCQGGPPKVVTKPTPILHSTHQTPNHCTMGSTNRISFKNDGKPSTSRDNLRYCNDWNKRIFTNYVNSKGDLRQQEEEPDQDTSLQMQLNDASYWLQRHFSGVVAKAAARNGATDTTHAQMRQP